MTGRRVLLRFALPAAVAVGAAVVLAPFLDANEFRPGIQAALERALHRQVTVGQVHFSLLRGPGFSVDDVLIKDAPDAGVEPFVYVPSMQASLRLVPLFAGHVAFSMLRLDEPTVNLVKTASGAWNVHGLAAEVPAAQQASGGSTLPDIAIRSGRLNFKFGETKSVFYVNAADADIYQADAGVIGVRFTGEPARTDRAAAGFGSISGRGLLNNRTGAEPQLSLGLVLEQSNLSDIVTLIDGHDIGVHGSVTASTHLAGPLSRIGITGGLTLSDLHRWDLIPSGVSDTWPLTFEGVWDVRGQNLEIHTATVPAQPQPFSVEARLSDYLASPHWAVKASFREVPASPLAEIARRFGVPLPAGIHIDGNVSGAVDYAAPGLLNGRLDIARGSITSTAEGNRPAATARMDAASIDIGNGEITFGPAALDLADGESVTLRASYRLPAQRLSLRLDTEKLSVEQVQSGAVRALGILPPSMLAYCKGGSWRGWTEYDWLPPGAGAWSGRFELSNTEIALPELSSPFHIVSAAVAMDDARLQVSRLHGRAGKLVVDGEVRDDDEPRKPVFVRLHISSAGGEEIQRLVAPVLTRPVGLLARLRISRSTLPDWLKDRHVEGSLKIDELSLGDAPRGSVSARLNWSGPAIELKNLEWTDGDASGSGDLDINVAGAMPRYHLTGRVENPNWRDGELSIEGSLTASGRDTALLASASAEGTFEAKNVTLAADESFDAISGAFRFAPGAQADQLRLLSVQARQDQETFTGQGSSQADGKILLELNSAKRQIRELTAGLLH